MKRIISTVLLAATVLAAVFALSACGKDSDIPDGMQLVAGGESDGYYFYAPEEWTISNLNNIKSAYVSRVDTTSVSFYEIDLSQAIPAEINKSEYFFSSYFNDNLSEFPEGTEVTLNGEATVFGKEKADADKAVKYTYNYTYDSHKFGFLQILIEKNGRFFIFTYCAVMEERSGGKTYYDYHMERAQTVIEEFRFADITAEKEATEYKEVNGMLLISDGSSAGYDLYVPKTFTPKTSSAYILATHSDGSNISMSESMMNATININEYFEIRKKELSAFVTDFTVIPPETPVKEGVLAQSVSFGDANAAWRYEYTFIYNGEQYHICQIFAVEGSTLFAKGYVFTYTAKEVNYNLHLEEVQQIIEKVNFR